MYFPKFPFTWYSVEQDGDLEIVQNILKRVNISDTIKQNGDLFFEYTIRDSDTPQIIAEKLYGTPEYFWLILHMNDIISVYESWPKNSIELQKFIDTKYDDGNTGIHHYVDANGLTVNSTEAGAQPVTNFEYENNVNEAKRNIRLLSPTYVRQAQSELETLLNGG